MLSWVAVAQKPAEYVLLKRFYETRDPKTALFLLDNYPEGVFINELKIELAYELVRRGEVKKAREVLKGVRLSAVRDKYGDKVEKVWKELRLEPKPFVLRFPERGVEFIDGVSLTERERNRVFNRLLFRKKYKEIIGLKTAPCRHRGIALFRTKNYAKALEVLRDCPDEKAQLYALFSYMRLRKFIEAERFLRERDDPDLYFAYGWSFLARGKYAEARRYFILSGDNFRALFYTGIVDYLRGRYRRAYEYFSRAEKHTRGSDQRARVLFWKAKTAERLGFADLSREYLRKTAGMGGFYGAVAKKLLQEPIYERVSFKPVGNKSRFMTRLEGIYKLGFLHYMRLEAFQRGGSLTPADLFRLVKIDPYSAIRLSANRYGVKSNIYRSLAFPTPFKESVKRATARFKVDPALIYAVMRQESLFNVEAVSRSNAKGLMQLLDGTARWMAQRIKYRYKDLFEVETNITLGTAYLRFLLDYWNGDLVRAIASYNAGQGAVSRWVRHEDDFLFIETIPYRETRKYVKRVLWFYYTYREKLLYESF